MTFAKDAYAAMGSAVILEFGRQFEKFFNKRERFLFPKYQIIITFHASSKTLQLVYRSREPLLNLLQHMHLLQMSFSYDSEYLSLHYKKVEKQVVKIHLKRNFCSRSEIGFLHRELISLSFI